MPLWFWILFAAAGYGLVVFGAGVMVGRHSKVEAEVNEVLDRELYHPVIKPQAAADKDEPQGGAP